MKNITDVLRQKESDLAETQAEVAAIRFVLRLLAEPTDAPIPPKKTEVPFP
jgi:hypothetical protein